MARPGALDIHGPSIWKPQTLYLVGNGRRPEHDRPPVAIGLYPAMRIIHVFLDNARYHHAGAVQDWLALPGRRIRLHFVPAYCPHLNPIERL